MVAGLDLGLDAAGAGEAPAAEGFKDGKDAGDDEEEAPEGVLAGDDDASDEADGANDAAGDAPIALDVGAEELAHQENLPHSIVLTRCERTATDGGKTALGKENGNVAK